jgi:CBS domain-containing protein
MAVNRENAEKPAPAVVINFLKDLMPFNELDEAILQDLARHCHVEFFPKGTRLFTANKSEVPYLYLIQQGAMQCFITDDEGEITLKDYRGEGAVVGALPIIRGTLANLDVETMEDTFCFLLPREVFLNLIHTQPGFAQFYLKSFSEKIVTTAYSELRRHRMNRRSSDNLFLFNVRAGDIIKRLRKVPATATIQETAAAMTREKVGSLLIHDPDDATRFFGIVTDRDLRSKVVAAGLDYHRPVRDIMSAPLFTTGAQEICFDVIMKMMTTGIHHLAVERDGQIIGVVTSHDIMLLQGHSPFYLFKEIVAQPRISDLYVLAGKIPNIIRNLIKEGGKAGNITRMTAILNDQILIRMLTLLEQELGPPPVNYCWMLLGSEGRREQTFKTDQDNALIYADPKDDNQRQQAAAYFKEFTRQAIDHLVKCGYPLCPGEVMAVNPRWCQPLSVWKDYFSRWIGTPDPMEVLHSDIFFDFRAGYGDRTLATELRDHLGQLTRRQEIYLLHMARHCMNSRVPLSFFRSFIVERDGEHRNKLDIKHQGLTPFVDFARVLSLKHQIRETNTLERLAALAVGGHISAELAGSAAEAYELQMQLRLIHQLHQLDDGKNPDNHIDPSQLTELEKRMLKDSFSVIERLHNVLRSIFPQS